MWKAFASLRIKGEFKPRADSLQFILHYRYTVLFFLVSATLTTLYDFVGKKIDCMMSHDDGDLKKIVDSYCYITGTFSVDKLHSPEYRIGKEIPHVGVGQYDKPEGSFEGDDLTFHIFYQWVPFVLIAQGALFYLPHMIWKRYESGLFRTIIQNLSIRDYLGQDSKGIKMGNYYYRNEQFETLSVYLTEYSASHRGWAYRFIGCELLNVLVTVFNVVFTNYFLGGAFSEFGLKVFEMSDMDPENRTDVMAQVFPRMAKCEFKLFGPSGTIEERDVMCMLPTNIANEKIYLVMWFWLLILAIIGSLWMLVRVLSLVRPVRDYFFLLRFYYIPHWSNHQYQPVTSKIANRDEIDLVLDTSYSNYLLLCQLASNMETQIFCEFLKYLAQHTMKIKEQEQGTDSGIDTVDNRDTLPKGIPMQKDVEEAHSNQMNPAEAFAMNAIRKQKTPPNQIYPSFSS